MSVCSPILLVETDPVGETKKEWTEGEEGKQRQRMKAGVVRGGGTERTGHT